MIISKRINYQWYFSLFFILAGIVLSFLALSVYYYHESNLRKVLNYDNAVYEITLKKDVLEYDFASFEKIIQTLQSNEDFIYYLKNPNHDNYTRSLQIFDSIAKTHSNLMQLRYIDENGIEKIRIDRNAIQNDTIRISQENLQDKSKRDYFLEASALPKGKLYVSDLNLNIEHAKIEYPYKPVLRFAIGVFDSDKKRGILIVNVFMEKLLKEITDSSAFNIYIYDQDNYLLFTNNESYTGWNKYLKNNEIFHIENFVYSSKLIGLGDEVLYIGAEPKNNSKITAEDTLEIFLMLIGVIIPFSFIMAYILSKIPKKLFDELENQQKVMLQQSKMAAVGEMIGAIAHQWRQPLNAISVLAQEIELKFEYGVLDKYELKKLGEDLQNNIDYMSNTINDFRDFFKPAKNKTIFNSYNAIKDSLDIVGKQLENNHIKLTIDIENKDIESYDVEGYESEFKQVIINLISNSREAIEEYSKTHPKIEKLIKINLHSTKGYVIIKLEDTGGGIAKEVLTTLFDLYVSTKNEQQGTGLGLYMSKLIIEKHMLGTLSVLNKNLGAEFTISLAAINK